MSTKDKLIQEAATLLTKKAMDAGLIIEAGWLGYSLIFPKDAGQVQIEETKMAFFAGADHLYSSIMNALDPGDDETPTDIRRMELIDTELGRFREKLKLRFTKIEGRG